MAKCIHGHDHPERLPDLFFDVEILVCANCRQPWDEWHEARKGKLQWLPCKWLKRLGF